MIEEIPEKLLELENHFILRLPLVEANYIHGLLKQKPKKISKILKLDLDADSGISKICVMKKRLNGLLKNLPTITESYKTYDGVNLYKIANINQILICQNEMKNQQRNSPHGLAPSLKNARKRRFRKSELKKIDEDLVKEIFYLLKTDLESVSSRFEIIYEENKQQNLFGDVSDSNQSDST